MFVVDSCNIVDSSSTTKPYDPMLTDVLQDSDSDLGFESLTSSPIEQASDMDDFEQNVERWESEDFNIFDYIGADEEEQDQGSSLANDPKDQMYKQWAYNQTTFGGSADYGTFQTSYSNNPSSSTGAAMNQQAGTAFDASAYDYGSTSSSSMTGTAAPSSMNGIASYFPGKQEPTYIYDPEELAYAEDEYPSKPPSATIPNDPFVIAEKVNAATKKPPRKYRLKSDNEKVNPVYKTKRAKNNDAVRRSREKAKISQQQKEQRLEMLEADIRTLYDYHLKTVEYIKQNCGCGLGLPKPPKLQTMTL